MNLKDLMLVLAQIGIPFAFHHWEKPPAPPYGAYLYDSTENFAADNQVYLVIENCRIEIYTKDHDQQLQDRIEEVLEGAGIYWDRDTEYIESLRLYQITYEIEV